MGYIVVEYLNYYYPYIISDCDGIPIIYSTKEAAEKEVSQCHNAKIVEL